MLGWARALLEERVHALLVEEPVAYLRCGQPTVLVPSRHASAKPQAKVAWR